MVDHATCLRFYKRPEIQNAIVALAKDKEVAVKYGDKGFGKRPDILSYPAEVLEFAKQGVTSFHLSEERWTNPLDLMPGMSKGQLDDLRSGWDLIIDIDSKNWQISKLATWLIVKTLRDINIANVSVKFSGNKGFHIGIPFETFPSTFSSEKISSLFPDFPKKIAQYLIEEINTKHITYTGNDSFIFGGKQEFTTEELLKYTEGNPVRRCRKCKESIKPKDTDTKADFVCPNCASSISADADFMTCQKCSRMMEKIDRKQKNTLCPCGSNDAELNPYAIIDIDTLLISSRHMYRCIYSLNEKSGLASIPVPLDKILDFNKASAIPDNVVAGDLVFLDPKDANPDNILPLFKKASEFGVEHRIKAANREDMESSAPKTFQEMTESAPRDYFPPCIQNILKGMEDGKKRALFVLVNFLKNVGWDKEAIEEIVGEWNDNNHEPLKENILVGHLRYHTAKKKVLPPNCDNRMYYIDMQMCTPDNLCKYIKNPVNYTRRKVFATAKPKKAKSIKKAEAKHKTSKEE